MWQDNTTKLATAKKSRVSLRVTKTLARAGGAIDPVKYLLIYVDHHAIFAVSHTVCAYVRVPENVGDAGWGVADP